jgi:hypothetical protein
VETPRTPEDLSDAVMRLCHAQPIDAVLPAIAAALGRLVVLHGCPPAEVLAIVAQGMTDWVALAGVSRSGSVRVD